MKKNKTMRAASALLVAVLLTTSVVSGTFAKYTTEGSAGDEARVAKWGVRVVATTDNIFDTSYNNDSNVMTVKAECDVIAPGTSKSNLTDLTLTGNPEVAVRVSYTADLVLTGWKYSDDSEYCPLVFTVENTDYYIGNGTITTVEQLENAVETAILNCSKEYVPNTNLAETASTADAPTIAWSWPYSTPGNDVKDTYLGDVADGKYEGKTAATVSLTTNVLVEQVD